jgi:serine/threonine-protein kinase HipA
MTAKTLNVWWDGSFVGQFTQDRHGDISFTFSSLA